MDGLGDKSTVGVFKEAKNDYNTYLGERSQVAASWSLQLMSTQ